MTTFICELRYKSGHLGALPPQKPDFIAFKLHNRGVIVKEDIYFYYS